MKIHHKRVHILQELGEHFPYTFFAALVGVIFIGIITYVLSLFNRQDTLPGASGELFHVFHPLHLFLSSIATTAMFWRHDRRLIKTVAIGFFGTIIPCGLSDAVIPFLGGLVLGIKMEFHLCIIVHPLFIMPFLVLGILIGFLVPTIQKSTMLSHGAHVLVSSMASILYLISYGLTEWIGFAWAVIIIIVLAVMIPCCFSDIVFPLMFLKHEGSCP